MISLGDSSGYTDLTSFEKAKKIISVGILKYGAAYNSLGPDRSLILSSKMVIWFFLN